MRTVFIGTSEFAATVLRRLATSPHGPLLVVTRPDRPRGRGQRLTPPPVAVCARELGIEIVQPASVNDEQTRALIADVEPEMLIVSAYGGLIGEQLLSVHAILNVHPSLLPRWRGAAPIERAIIAGDELTGVSIMRVTASLDAGPVCAQRSEPIAAVDTYGTLSERLARHGGELLVQTLEFTPPCRDQDDSRATYAEKISGEDRWLDPAATAIELERRVRALEPHVRARVELPDGVTLGVRHARALPSDAAAPGALSLAGPRPMLGCAEGSLELLVVQPPGRKAMSGEDYVRGLHSHAGS
ncbi:MAG TPA: methionyl-tRNA formyltransferase [Solirubrobacteraceae bacterium]